MTWTDKKLDGDFLVTSGLLYHLNHTVFHPLGIAMTVKDKFVQFRDSRAEPEALVLDKNTIAMGAGKLEACMKEWGYKQMERRRKKLGWAVQPVPQIAEKGK